MAQSSKRATIESTTLEFTPIAAQSDAELTMTVNGVFNTGDEIVVVSAPVLEAGLMATGYVSATDEVTIRVSNVTAGAIDPAEQDFNVAVIQ